VQCRFWGFLVLGFVAWVDVVFLILWVWVVVFDTLGCDPAFRIDVYVAGYFGWWYYGLILVLGFCVLCVYVCDDAVFWVWI